MLETESASKKEGEEKSKGNKAVTQDQTEQKLSRPTDIKVIVEKDIFKDNLEKHKLNVKKKEIKMEQVKIKIEVEELKKMAFMKIYIGLAIIAIGLGHIVVTFRSSPTGFDMSNYREALVIIAVGIVFQFYFGGPKGKSK